MKSGRLLVLRPNMLCTNIHLQILHKNGKEGDLDQSSSYTMSCHVNFKN
jgi:hypothetical protein